jgi:HK97 family phage major capsid protein
MSVVTANDRHRLKAVQDRKRELRELVSERQSEAASVAVNADGTLNRNAPSVVALMEAKSELEEVSSVEQQIVSRMAGMVSGRRAGLGGGSFADDPAMARTLEQLAHSSAPIGSLMLGEMCSAAEVVDRIRSGHWGGRDGFGGAEYGAGMYAADSSSGLVDTTVGGGAARIGPWQGILPQLRRRLRLLDLIPTQTMDNASFSYTRELGSFDAAVETAELATTPAADVDFEDAEVNARTISSFFKASRQSLADVPQLLTSLNTRLIYGVFRRVENQILAGDGTGQNLLGILNTTGIADVAYVSGDVLTDLALAAITDVLVSDAIPDAVIAHPVDVATMLRAKAAGSGQRLDSAGAFAGVPSSLWGLPLITSTAISQGTALVGDWSQGATLWVREGVTIRTSDSDQDDFIKARMTILGEGRFGLSCERPACFAVVHFE